MMRTASIKLDASPEQRAARRLPRCNPTLRTPASGFPPSFASIGSGIGWHCINGPIRICVLRLRWGSQMCCNAIFSVCKAYKALVQAVNRGPASSESQRPGKRTTANPRFPTRLRARQRPLSSSAHARLATRRRRGQPLAKPSRPICASATSTRSQRMPSRVLARRVGRTLRDASSAEPPAAHPLLRPAATKEAELVFRKGNWVFQPRRRIRRQGADRIRPGNGSGCRRKQSRGT